MFINLLRISLMSRKADKPKPVSVYVRCRPRSQAEKTAGSPSIIECTRKEVIVRHGNANLNKKYTFDHVYGPQSSQVDVYKGKLQTLLIYFNALQLSCEVRYMYSYI